MADFVNYSFFLERLRLLNDKLEFNLRKMEDIDSKSPIYKKLYLENEDLIRELVRLTNS